MEETKSPLKAEETFSEDQNRKFPGDRKTGTGHNQGTKQISPTLQLNYGICRTETLARKW